MGFVVFWDAPSWAMGLCPLFKLVLVFLFSKRARQAVNLIDLDMPTKTNTKKLKTQGNQANHYDSSGLQELDMALAEKSDLDRRLKKAETTGGWEEVISSNAYGFGIFL